MMQIFIDFALHLNVRLFGGERGSKCNSTELVKQGFEFKFNMAKIIDDSVECGRRLGVFSNK